MSDDTQKVRLIVKSQEVIFSKPNGTTLYQVHATDEDGREIPDLDLRTFSDLPKDEAQEFTLKKYSHPEHGVSWTIQMPSGGLSKRVDELTARLGEAEARIKSLEDRLGDPEAPTHPAHADEDIVRGPSWGA